MREIEDDEGRRLLRIIRRGTGSVVTWRRAQMVLLSAQDVPVAKIAEVTFTSADRVRDVIHNFNADGFEALYPKYKGGRPRTFTLRERRERREIKKITKSKPAEHGLPFRPGVWPSWQSPGRPASNTSTPSPTARSYPRTANPKSSYAWTSSARSTSSPTPDDSGPSAADGTRTPAESRGPVGGRPTPARTGSGACSSPTTWARTRSTATSSPRLVDHG
nr:helix-turn-helix domain-containing protein [Streptomyces scopuliridis]